MKPHTTDNGRSEPVTTPSFSERIAMAFLAPLFFNFSLLICLGLFSRRSRAFAWIASYEGLTSSWGWLAILVLVPAVVGYRLGAERCAILLGHFFYTNLEHEKNVGKTALAWGCLLVVAYLIAHLLPHT